MSGAPSLAGPGPRRYVYSAPVMGTVVTFDLRLASDAERDGAGAAVAESMAWLRWADQTFTTYSEGSWVRRVARGDARAEDGPPELAEVVALCHMAFEMTGGWFDPWAPPARGFDPSGLVKGWATQKAAAALATAGFSC
jgi:thiamine biosynthesis lipoprotein